MIPKMIHYCWFGKGKMPKLTERCLKSWNKHLYDYKLMLWNEDNFDINSNRFVKEAYNEGKWAFVSDYVRLYALYNYGGVYLDTDVEVIRNFDNLLENKAFSGFENDKEIPTGLIAAEANNEWISKLLEYYNNKSFYKENGELDQTTNVHIITEISKRYGFIQNSKMQSFMDGVVIYPKDYFCPKNYETGKIKVTNNTYCIHHFSGSWKEKNTLYYFEKIFSLILGKKVGKRYGNKVFWKLYNTVKGVN